MSVLRRELINAVNSKAYALTDVNIHDNIDKEHEFRKKMVLDDESLTKDEKSEAIRSLTENYDTDKLIYNKGKKRICENCQLECLATSYCELCIRNYLKANFSNWSSGNNDIDDLIQKCQIETIYPYLVIEWIPYNNFQNIKYLTKGGFSEIYTADLIGGGYQEWDSKEQQLIRQGTEEVILKRLENVKSANRSWFDEAKSHLGIGNKLSSIAQCLGLTQNPSNKDYMLVMGKFDIDLRNYLKQNHNQLTWKKSINISYYIILSVYYIHQENAIHRDLHSGNILYLQKFDQWYISDLGFCGPADKPLGSIYGNLPYIAPEVIAGKGYTFQSDIYSIGMLMWEISSAGQIPFANFKYSDYDLAMNIMNGIRPKIGSGIPLEYKELIQQCWDANPEKRPDINTLNERIKKLNVFYKDENETRINDNNILQLNTNSNTSSSSINSLNRKFSKIHIFEGLSAEPKNATEEEQEAFHSKLHDFSIPNNIEDIESENQTKQSDFTMIDAENDNNNEKNKSKRIYSENNSDDEEEVLENKSKKIKLENNNNDGKYDEQYHSAYNEVEFQLMKRNHHITSDNINEICNDPNLHAEEQDELEIPEDGF